MDFYVWCVSLLLCLVSLHRQAHHTLDHAVDDHEGHAQVEASADRVLSELFSTSHHAHHIADKHHHVAHHILNHREHAQARRTNWLEYRATIDALEKANLMDSQAVRLQMSAMVLEAEEQEIIDSVEARYKHNPHTAPHASVNHMHDRAKVWAQMPSPPKGSKTQAYHDSPHSHGFDEYEHTGTIKYAPADLARDYPEFVQFMQSSGIVGAEILPEPWQHELMANNLHTMHAQARAYLVKRSQFEIRKRKVHQELMELHAQTKQAHVAHLRNKIAVHSQGLLEADAHADKDVHGALNLAALRARLEMLEQTTVDHVPTWAELTGQVESSCILTAAQGPCGKPASLPTQWNGFSGDHRDGAALDAVAADLGGSTMRKLQERLAADPKLQFSFWKKNMELKVRNCGFIKHGSGDKPEDYEAPVPPESVLHPPRNKKDNDEEHNAKAAYALAEWKDKQLCVHDYSPCPDGMLPLFLTWSFFVSLPCLRLSSFFLSSSFSFAAAAAATASSASASLLLLESCFV